jgi:N-acetylglucosaminyldiphosphoundecaprenol N-acetyl-beta-D-mannosaminyltransferase
MYEDDIPLRSNILGVNVSSINMEKAIETVRKWIENKTPNYVCVTPAHGILDCQNNPELLEIFNSSGLTTPDGMAIVWLLKLSGHKDVSRVYGPDLMLEVCSESIKAGWRHFFYGGEPGVAEELVKKLTTNYPGLQVVGTYTPPFRNLTYKEDQEIISFINSVEPDIIWVGISTPKQERWMASHVGKVSASVIIGVGAAFDFHSGRKKQAPHWMQRSGLEWLYRLLSEPKRLWRRYAKYPRFVILVVAQLAGIKKFHTR